MHVLEGPLWLLTGEATAVACGGDSLLQDVAGAGAGETAVQAERQGRAVQGGRLSLPAGTAMVDVGPYSGLPAASVVSGGHWGGWG